MPTNLQAPVARRHPEIAQIVAELSQRGRFSCRHVGQRGLCSVCSPTNRAEVGGCARLEASTRRAVVILTRTVARRGIRPPRCSGSSRIHLRAVLPGKVSIG